MVTSLQWRTLICTSGTEVPLHSASICRGAVFVPDLSAVRTKYVKRLRLPRIPRRVADGILLILIVTRDHPQNGDPAARINSGGSSRLRCRLFSQIFIYMSAHKIMLSKSAIN